ncbi:metallopeptidase [Rhodospirillales bacterium TMPK1]|uniref:Metallopeptidase n=2 Tax=Roseiterribacter gracilis TaxID=2812848 RepID=A0A8S8XE58_9PROT|nr:metallopeptidase [Rhodospirillales bacterium TMPK1]
MSLDPANIDPSAQPCDDFFAYSTGGWMKANPIPASEPRWGNFNKLADDNLATMRGILDKLAAGDGVNGDADFQKIGAYFKSCMDEAAVEAAGLKPIEADLKRIASLKDRKAIVAEIANLHAVGVPVFFAFGQEPDPKDSKRTIAQIQQGGLSLPNRDYYFKDDAKSKSLRDAFRAYVVTMSKLAGQDDATAGKTADAVLRIETDLAKGSKSPVDLRDPEANYHLVKQAQLKTYAPSVDWGSYYKQANVATGDIDLSQPDFLKAVERVVTKSAPDDLKAYLGWQVLRSNANALPKAFVDEAFAFRKQLTGAKELQPRWKRCTIATTGAMPDAVGKAFVTKAVDPETKARALKMVQNLRATLAEDIKTLDWMGAATKQQAAVKLDKMAEQIVNPNVWIDYSALQPTEPFYASNLRGARAWEVKHELAKIGKPTSKDEWQMSPMITNAYYEPLINVIVFPAGILMPPFFDAKADDAVNYGGIGAVIGHEMTHGFDDQGRQYDSDGLLRDWWTKEDGKRFNAKAQCIVDQFSGYTVVDDVKENGKLVQGESIADLGGLAVAYRAFQKTEQAKKGEKIDNLTPEQRFFLSYGQIWAENSRPEFARLQALTDPHPAAKFRVNGTVSNLAEFAKAFQCKPGSAMVRATACKIW